MDLLQLKYFCMAAETQNFSKTAERFFVPATSVSQTVKRLEEELGTRLFSRTPNKVILNSAGRAFYEKIKTALALIDDATSVARATSDNATGTISILAHTCRRIVTQAVEMFSAKYPEIQFVIHHTSTSGGEYDFIVSDKTFSSRLAQKRLLLREPILLACHRTHPFASQETVSPNALDNQPFIAMSAGNSMHEILTRICEQENVTLKIAIQSDDPYYVKKYLDEGLGLAFVPSVSWKNTLSKNTLLKPFGAYARDTFVFYDEPKFLSFAQKEFLQTLITTFQKEN